MQAILVIAGALSEFAGVVMIAFPDLLPGARRSSAWIGRRARIIENGVRRLLGRRPAQPQVFSVAGGGAVASGGKVSFVVSVKPDATPEEKLDFLLRRAQDLHTMIDAVGERVAVIETKSPKDLEQLRAGMEDHVGRALAAAAAEYRDLRVAGTFALALGLVCVTVANFT